MLIHRIIKIYNRFKTPKATSFQECVVCGKTIIGNPWRNLFHESFCKRCFCTNEVNINHNKPTTAPNTKRD